MLNGSVVDKYERRDSELHYLRSVLAETDGRPETLQALRAQHPQLVPLQAR